MNRDTANLFWLRDETLEESDKLPDPEVLAHKIVNDLEAALEQFGAPVPPAGKRWTTKKEKKGEVQFLIALQAAIRPASTSQQRFSRFRNSENMKTSR